MPTVVKTAVTEQKSSRAWIHFSTPARALKGARIRDRPQAAPARARTTAEPRPISRIRTSMARASEAVVLRAASRSGE